MQPDPVGAHTRLVGSRWGCEGRVRPCIVTTAASAVPQHASRHPLPLVGLKDGRARIFELPSRGSPRRQAGSGIVVRLLSGAHGGSLFPCELLDDFAAPSGEDDEIAGIATAFAAELGRHIDFVHDAFQAAAAEQLGPGGSAAVVPCRLEHLRALWRDRAGSAQASYALVVRLAEDVQELILDLCTRPRRLLRRERQFQPAHRVQEMDGACLRWLARQPGTTLAEQIGGAGRVLAVQRVDSVDTFENRVLRDFLSRCSEAAREYVHANLAHTGSARVRLVRGFGDLARRLLDRSTIAAVGALSGPVAPNYVLQYDPRYSTVWQWYTRLRRRESEQDELWSWRQRAWAEMLALACVRHLDELEAGSVGGHAFEPELLVSREHRCGCFLDPRAAIGPFLLASGRDHVLVELALLADLQRTPGAAAELGDLLTLAPDFVIRVTPGRGRGPARLVPVWAELPGPRVRTDLEADTRRLAALVGRRPGPTSVACLLRGHWGEAAAARSFLAGDTPRTLALEVPVLDDRASAVRRLISTAVAAAEVSGL